MSTALLAPASILVIWSLIMLFWLAAARLPATAKMGVDITKKTGGRGQDIDPVVPPQIAWKSHNYSHLMEQPTLFYATVVILTLAHAVSPTVIGLTWAYVILRIAHSLWQALINKVLVRFILFIASTLCLLAMAVIALLATL